MSIQGVSLGSGSCISRGRERIWRCESEVNTPRTKREEQNWSVLTARNVEFAYVRRMEGRCSEKMVHLGVTMRQGKLKD
jgi:hypothetical protein